MLPATPAFALSGVEFRWPGAQGFGLRVDDFAVTRGEKLLILGPSGSGKSTLLSLLCGVVTPQAGRVRVLGTDIVLLSGAARDRFRADHFGIVFQMLNLLPYASVIDNVLLPLRFSKARRARISPGASESEEARRLLSRLGLEAKLHDGPPAASLSVGQQQRVAAARALIGAPEIIVADEPTSSLDRERQQAFLDLLLQEAGRVGATIVMVSHDESLRPHFDRAVPLERVAAISWQP
ncbi:MAG: ABC transporter ATP-binding protein [Rhodospirillaceae bacterium]|nr:ABC transporter ATP-binding protein [Rhodospirillaceae bacterium]